MIFLGLACLDFFTFTVHTSRNLRHIDVGGYLAFTLHIELIEKIGKPVLELDCRCSNASPTHTFSVYAERRFFPRIVEFSPPVVEGFVESST
jgi:hypothetical protein